MFDFENDQLGVFDQDTADLYKEDIGFEQEDETLSALSALFDDEFSTLELKIEDGDKPALLEYLEKLQIQFSVVCDDEFSVDGTHYFELLLTEYELPPTMELLGEGNE